MPDTSTEVISGISMGIGCGEYVILKKLSYFSREFRGEIGSVF